MDLYLLLDMERDVLFVTFDSNVYRPAAEPTRFPNDPDHSVFVRIHHALRAGEIEGRLSETIFTLEGISKVDRKNFFVRYKPRVKLAEEEHPDGSIRITMCIAPDLSAHPGSNPYLSSHLNDALAVGFKLMHCPRVAGILNPDLCPEWFVQTSGASALAYDPNKFGEVARKIEESGAGIASIKAIGNQYAAPTEAWFQGLAKALSTEDKPIASAVAEWADADSVSAHVAYRNHFFCTRDVASAAGAGSTFSAANRAWLSTDYGVRFVTPSELADHV